MELESRALRRELEQNCEVLQFTRPTSDPSAEFTELRPARILAREKQWYDIGIGSQLFFIRLKPIFKNVNKRISIQIVFYAILYI